MDWTRSHDGSRYGDPAHLQCPYSSFEGSTWTGVYVTVLDGGGNGVSGWKAVQCNSGYS